MLVSTEICNAHLLWCSYCIVYHTEHHILHPYFNEKVFKNLATAVKNQDSHFTIYVWLFIIMGITWISGFISAFTDELAVQIIFVILNSLQGLFLFISFVCNKAVLSEMRTKRKENSSTTPGKKTKSTPVSGSKSDPNSSKSESKMFKVLCDAVGTSIPFNRHIKDTNT